MLDGRADALRLKAIDVCGSNRAVQNRVLGEALEAATAKRGALGIDGGPEKDMAAWRHQWVCCRGRTEGHIPLARHSSASALPTSSARSTSKEEPRPVEEGNALEGTPLKTVDVCLDLDVRAFV